MLLVYVPQGSTLESRNGKLYLGDAVVDYHYGYNFEGVFGSNPLSSVIRRLNLIKRFLFTVR